MMFHAKVTAALNNGGRATTYFWANGGAARVQSRTSLVEPEFGPETYWSGVDAFRPANGVADFFRDLLTTPGASIASVR